MRRKKIAPTHGKPAHSYWERRFRTKAFRQNLALCIARELADLSQQPVREVVDSRQVRNWIRSWKLRDVDRVAAEDFLLWLGARFANRVRGTDDSMRNLLESDLTAGIEALLAEDLLLSRATEDFIAAALRQEFVHNLLVDVIHTAIVSFNKRVNPLFAGITNRVLDDQIKGFIGLFMPMLQEQAVAFATRKSNQSVLLDFARSIFRQILDEPIGHFTFLASPSQRRQAETLVGKLVRSSKLESILREAGLEIWDGGYERIRRKKVGAVVDLERHGQRWSVELADLVLPILSHAHVLDFVAEEIRIATRR